MVKSAGWCVSVCVDAARWGAETRVLQQYLEAKGQRKRESAMEALVRAGSMGRGIALGVAVLTVLALSLLWLRKSTPRREDGGA